MSSILIRTAVVVLLLAVLGFGTGRLFGAGWGWAFFSLRLVGLLVHHVRHLHLLGQSASRSLTEAVPEGSGGWVVVRTLPSLRRLAAAAAFARHHAGYAPGDHAPRLRRERFARAAHPAHRAGGVPGDGAGAEARSGTLARLPESHGRAEPAHAAHHRRPAHAVHARIGARAAARRARKCDVARHG